MRNALITGATGFIGNWLTNLLLDNHIKVFLVVRNVNKLSNKIKAHPNAVILNYDLSGISDLRDIITEDIDVFYHLAWEGASGIKRSDYNIQLSNIKNSMECIFLAEKLNVQKFITVGTIGENLADLSIQNKVVSENYIYAISKSYLQRLLRITTSKMNLKLIWCTLSGIYGEGDHTNNLINYTVKSLLMGEEPEYGPGTQLFDFLHVEDCVRALFLIGCRNNTYDNYYIGSGSPHMLKEYLLCIKDMFGNKAAIRLGAKDDDGTRYLREWFDTTNLEDDYKFIVSNHSLDL